MRINLEKAIEYLFYILILFYFVGKVFKGISFLIDILFIIHLSFNKNLALDFFNKYKSLIMSFVFFAAYLILQSLFVDYTLYSLKSSFETLLYFILFFSALFIFTTEDKIKKVIYVSFIALMIVSIDSFYQYFTGYDIFGKPLFTYGSRITAWNDMPKVSLMMGEFFGLLIASMLLFKNNLKKIAIIVLITVLILFILSGNRSPIVALFSAFVFVSLFSNHRKYLLGILLLFGLGFATLSFTNSKLSHEYKKLLNPTTNQATSSRFPIYLTAIEIIKDHPMIGIGSHNYGYYHLEYIKKVDWKKYKNYYVERFMDTKVSHAHNVLLDMILSYGVLGILFFVYVLYNIYMFFIKDNSIGWIASIGFIYCITPFQFGRNFTMGDWQFITYLGLIFLALMSVYNLTLKKK